jgi:hypothetical protein
LEYRIEKKQITFTLKNAGLGAAIIKYFNFIYKGKKYSSLEKYFAACCKKEYTALRENSIDGGEVLTSFLQNSILAGQSQNEFITVAYNEGATLFWNKLNDERFKTKLEVCYCSLLDDCYITRENGIAKSVKQCL